MPFNSSPITVKDAANADKAMMAFNDGTNNAFAQAVLDSDGALISPATEAKQDTAISHLSQIETATEATATAMTAANAKLDTLIANAAAGGVVLTSALTVTAGSAYTTGMVVGGKIGLNGAARVNSGSGLIQQAYVTKKTALTASFDLFVFNTDPSNSTFTDRATLAIDPADLNKLAGVIHCTDLVSCGTPQLLQAVAQAMEFKLSAANTMLYVVPVIRGNETYASTDAVGVSLVVIQD